MIRSCNGARLRTAPFQRVIHIEIRRYAILLVVLAWLFIEPCLDEGSCRCTGIARHQFTWKQAEYVSSVLVSCVPVVFSMILDRSSRSRNWEHHGRIESTASKSTIRPRSARN